MHSGKELVRSGLWKVECEGLDVPVIECLTRIAAEGGAALLVTHSATHLMCGQEISSFLAAARLWD